MALSGKFTHGLYSILVGYKRLCSGFSTKTTQQPIVYDHIISYHLLRRAYTNGYDLYCNINTETHKQMRLYVKNMYNMHQHY